MDNQKPNPAATLPWYDDRVEAVRKEYTAPVAEPAEKEPTQDTPRQIYDYLDRKVWKQAEAKKAASIILYNALRSIRSTAMFIGPSGCGKTHVWRCLQKLFPNRIVICDGSNLTLTGWKGNKTWSSLLTDPIFRSEKTR